jgi:hypothetical protein
MTALGRLFDASSVTHNQQGPVRVTHQDACWRCTMCLVAECSEKSQPQLPTAYRPQLNLDLSQRPFRAAGCLLTIPALL